MGTRSEFIITSMRGARVSTVIICPGQSVSTTMFFAATLPNVLTSAFKSSPAKLALQPRGLPRSIVVFNLRACKATLFAPVLINPELVFRSHIN